MLDATETVQILTADQEKMIEIMQSHLTLQDQFRQLTQHVEACYARIAELAQLVSNKVLS